LDPESIRALRSVLDEPDLASCIVDPVAQLAIVTLNVTGILPVGWHPEEMYPLHLVLHPLGRIMVSHRKREHPFDEGGAGPYRLQPVELSDIDQVISGFTYHAIEDSDLIDPIEDPRLQRGGDLSLDVQLGDQQAHMLEMWQDDEPVQLLEIGLWFDRIYLLDAEFESVTIPILEQWKQRRRDSVDAGSGVKPPWSLTGPGHKLPSPADMLARIEGVQSPRSLLRPGDCVVRDRENL
jgi:hypothetical protein